MHNESNDCTYLLTEVVQVVVQGIQRILPKLSNSKKAGLPGFLADMANEIGYETSVDMFDGVEPGDDHMMWIEE
jgi:hypothetical protein